MAYAIGKWAFLLLRPSNLLLILAAAGAVGLLLRKRWAVPLVGAAVLLMTLGTLVPVGLWLAGPLEDRFPPPAVGPAHVDGIVVLGGGVDGRLTEVRGQPSFGATMERFAAIAELARRYPAARILFTGGATSSGGGDAYTEAAVIKRFLAQQGVPEGRVLLEGRARSTRENALLTLQLARPQRGEAWLLVTSAIHMPRSIGVFRRAGWPELQPWPVDYRSTGTLEWLGEASLGARLAELDQAAYEWWGLLYYRLLGYTDAILPEPA